MKEVYKVALLGNRAMAIDIGGFLNVQDNVALFVVLNPDDEGKDEGQALSLKKASVDWACETYQPKGLKSDKQIAPLEAFAPDIIISCSYARIIPERVIDLPELGSYNIHFANLPRNRGCLPVVWTIAQQEPELCATLHEISPGIDDGAIISQSKTTYTAGMTAETATQICAELGVEAFKNYWESVVSGKPMPAVPQDENLITYHTMRFPYDRFIPWSKPANVVAAMINSLTFPPHPGARSEFNARFECPGEWYVRGPATVISFDDGISRCAGQAIQNSTGLMIVCGDREAVLVNRIEANSEDCNQDVLQEHLSSGTPIIFDDPQNPEYTP